MRVDPIIAALRSDPAPQRHAQAAMDAARRAWTDHAAVCLPLADLAAFGDGAPLGDLPNLSAVMTDLATASAFASGLVDSFAAAMRAEPLGLVPFRHQTTDSHVVLELARAGRAALSLMAYRPVAKPEPQSVCLTSGDRHEICLQGEAQVVTVAATALCDRGAELVCAPLTIRQGWSAVFDNARQGKLVTAVTRSLVILRLQRDLLQPLPAREYRLADGAMIHESAADRSDSRRELALALLGSMARKDALPVIADAARCGPDHVRWEAVRQALSLDSGAGFAILCDLARDSADPLAAAASALWTHLAQAYPLLLQADERAPCPA